MKIAFYKGKNTGIKGIFSKIIRYWDRTHYSHVEVLFEPDDNLIPYTSLVSDIKQFQSTSMFLCASAYPFFGVGFNLKQFSVSEWDIVDYRKTAQISAEGVEHITPQDVFNWFYKHSKSGYDYWGLFGFIVRRIGGNKKRWFCSEAVAAALGFPEPHRFTPSILASIFLRQN
jgi:hypothetical protein